MKVVNAVWLAAGIAAVAIAADGARLEIDPGQSRIEVAVTCTVDSFVAHLEKYQAAVECDRAADLPAKADVSFDFADLKTGEKGRDAAMLKWLGHDAKPTALFHLTGWELAGTTNIALGDLTIHGVTVAVRMPVTIKHAGEARDISGQAVFRYVDFKLPKIRKALLLTVDPKLKVSFQLSGKFAAN
jgi:polyisoprenoid-binding protein YceI